MRGCHLHLAAAVSSLPRAWCEQASSSSLELNSVTASIHHA
jgi:hypothetical protein